MCTACIMARRRGFVPVAETRLRTAGVCCSVCVLYVAFHEFQRKLLAPARTSPLQILFFFNTHTKIRAYSKSYTPLFWRGEEDLNLRRLLTSHDFQSCALNRSAISASLPGNLSAEPII